MRNSSSISESPGKSGRRVTISAKMQPMDQMSTGQAYWRAPSKISGARYHNVTTFVWWHVERGVEGRGRERRRGAGRMKGEGGRY